MKIHHVKTRFVNSYVVEYPDRLLVVDVAAKCHRYVLGFVEHELDRNVQSITLAVCTHDDPDHMGGLASLASLCGAGIAIPYASKDRVRKIHRNPSGVVYRLLTMVRETLRLRAWEMYANSDRDRQAKEQPKFQSGESQPTRRKMDPDHRLKHRAALPGFEDWQVIHTPGHSWDSCCFYHRESRSLLSGDTLLGSGTQNRLIFPSIYSNPRHLQQSLKTLRELPVETVYPGHGSILEGEDLLSEVPSL